MLRLYEISRCLALGTPALLIYSVKYCYKFVFFHERIGFLVLKELQDQLQAKRKELEEFRAKAREKSLKQRIEEIEASLCHVNEEIHRANQGVIHLDDPR